MVVCAAGAVVGSAVGSGVGSAVGSGVGSAVATDTGVGVRVGPVVGSGVGAEVAAAVTAGDASVAGLEGVVEEAPVPYLVFSSATLHHSCIHCWQWPSNMGM